MKNHITPKDLLGMSFGEVADLPIDQLAMLQDDIAVMESELKGIKGIFAIALEDRFKANIENAYTQKGDQFGKVTFNDLGFSIETSRAKNVSWDEFELILAENVLLNQWGEDPSEYINKKLTVSEAKFKAWPEKIRSLFTEARTVKPGKISIKIITGE